MQQRRNKLRTDITWQTGRPTIEFTAFDGHGGRPSLAEHFTPSICKESIKTFNRTA